MEDWKRNVHFVLVEPQEPGNIGAAARAIKNMGFRNLRLVRPPEVLTEEATWFARNALDVLGGALRFETLEEAIGDASFVICTTRRKGKRRGVFLPMEEGAGKVRDMAGKNKVAVLFGREQYGLYNEEIASCGFMLSIPVDRAQPSLNLAQAVLITAYELSKAGSEPRSGKPAKGLYIGQEEIAVLNDKVSGVLSLLGYGMQGDRDLKKIVMTNLRRFTGRAGLTRAEFKTLFSICSQVEKRLKDE